MVSSGTREKGVFFGRLSASKKKRLIFIPIGALLGIALLIFGGATDGKAKESSVVNSTVSLEQYAEGVEKKLHSLCEQVEGVSDVTAAVSFEKGFEYVYAKDDGEGNYLVIGSGSSECAVRVTEKPPTIGGIGIVCKGGGDPAVQNKLINLISAAFGVSSNKIYIAEAGR